MTPAKDLANGIADAISNVHHAGYHGHTPQTEFDTPQEAAAYAEAYAEGADRADEDAEERRNEARWGTWREQHGSGAWNSL